MQNITPSLAIVLVRPKLAENIGAVARAMINFGAKDLRLVKPAKYDKKTAYVVACDGKKVLDKAKIFTTLKAALADCSFTIGTSRRLRSIKIPTLNPEQSVEKLISLSNYQTTALVFGSARTGLTNQELFLCDAMSSITTTEKGSLNLSQAVLLYLNEWFKTLFQPKSNITKKPLLATHKEKQICYDIIEKLLYQSGYKPIAKLPEFTRKVKLLFEDRPLTSREQKILLKLLRYLEKINHSKLSS